MSEPGEENDGDAAGWLAGVAAALIGLPALVACCGGSTTLVALAGGGVAAAGGWIAGNGWALAVGGAVVAATVWHLRCRRADQRASTTGHTPEEQT